MFTQSCEYYLRNWIRQPEPCKQEIGRRCREKYPRGINLVLIPEADVGVTFTPNFTILDRGRIFLTFERLVNEVLKKSIAEEELEDMKKRIEEYDPMKTILWLFVQTGAKGAAEYCLFSTSLK